MMMDLQKILNDYGDSSEITVPPGLMDQIIGQEHAVEIVRIAAKQRRFLLIAGEPGTGKSLLGQAVSEIMSPGKLADIIAYENKDNRNMPLIRVMNAGLAKSAASLEADRSRLSYMSEIFLIYLASLAVILCGIYYFIKDRDVLWIFGSAAFLFFLWRLQRWIHRRVENKIPKVLVSHSDPIRVPFVDATGSRDGALFGDVRHDPYQSGGMETPSHMLLEAGAVHRANGGVLYIDEISTLSSESQQNLLTALETKNMPVMGRSPGSSGNMIRSYPIPCDFLLVMAGNMQDIEKIHPALRSRIRGYGYEIYTRTYMPVTEENTKKLLQFIAQEVRRDGKIPHVSAGGMAEILKEAQLRSELSDTYTLRLRELGGLVRIAGDIAVREGRDLVTEENVRSALHYAKSIEEQICEEGFRDD